MLEQLHPVSYDLVTRDGDAGLELTRPYWDALASHARYFFQLPEWVGGLPSEGMTWFAVLDGTSPAAVGALSRYTRNIWRKRLRILGSGVRMDGRIDNGMSFCGISLAHPTADPRAVVDRLLGYYQHDTKWDMMYMYQLRRDTLWHHAPVRMLATERPGIAVLDTDVPSADFWNAAPRNLKDGLRKSRRRLEREGLRTDIVEARRPAEVSDAFDAFVGLEGRGWKRSMGAYVGRPEAGAFLKRFLTSAARSRRVSLRSLLIGGRLAASQLAVQVQDSLFLFKMAYDETMRTVSPGNLLMSDLVTRACDDPSISRIDCVAPPTEWHSRWGMREEPTYRLVDFNCRTVTGLAGAAAWTGRRVARSRRTSTSPADMSLELRPSSGVPVA